MNEDMTKDLIICRCEEITIEEIRKAIAQGAITIAGVKRRTRAGMGFCQGRTCERLVAQILSQSAGKKLEAFRPPTRRPPIRAISFASLEQLSGSKN